MTIKFSYFYGHSNISTASVAVDLPEKPEFKKFHKKAGSIIKDIGAKAGIARKRFDEAAELDKNHNYDNLKKYQDKTDLSPLGRILYECGKLKDETHQFINEDDVIAAVLYAFFGANRTEDLYYINDEISLEEINITVEYRGDRYTGFLNEKLIAGKNGICGVKFTARKNDAEPSEFYLLTKTCLSEDGDIIQSPSYGIVEAGVNFLYAGALRHKALHIDKTGVVKPPEYIEDDDGFFGEDDDDYSGSEIEWLPEVDLYNTAHLFAEKNGDDFVFSVLILGKLYKKIERNNNAVTFYNTDICFNSVRAQSLNTAYLIFNKSGELKNIYSLNEFRTGSNEAFFGTELNMPQFPELGNNGNKNNTEVLNEFYLECINTFTNAFANAEKIETAPFISDDRSDKAVLKHLNEENKYIYPYSGSTITVRLCNTAECSEFEDSINIGSFAADIEKVSFKTCGITIEICFNGDKLNIVLLEPDKNPDEKADKRYEGNYNLLLLNSGFHGPDIRFNNMPYVFNFEDMQNIKNAVLDLGIEECKKKLSNNISEIYKTVEELLYENEDMVPDKNVVISAACLVNNFRRTGCIPNLAITGQAGTGKTTLAKGLGKLFGKGVSVLTPSDLRAPYLGQTKYEVVVKLAEAAKENLIFYVDEAYQLMNDEFGAEAITLLLPLMTGDRTKIDAYKNRSSITVDFREGRIETKDDMDNVTVEEFTPGIVPIWISGYDNEVRAMISKNQGLYRRLKKITIKNPVTSDLIDQFNRSLEKYAAGSDTAAINAQRLLEYFGRSGYDTVKKFFGWGIQPQNSKFFANHAGVNTFISDCLDSIDFNEDLALQIENIITSTKLDIKRQLSAIKKDAGTGSGGVSTTDELDSINVITDIDTRFSDLVGCSSQIAYMRSIIEMLVNKSIYENHKINVPKGALMEGLPGVGKTFIARAMAGELQERFQNEASDKRFGFMAVSGSELGINPASYISSIFRTAEEYDACILFIDEADSIAKHRNSNPFYSNYLELIKNMDGIEKSSNVFILAATNAPENLDPAFVRSGRIDKKLEFTLPDKNSRKELARRALIKRIKALIDLNSPEKESGINTISEFISKKMSGYTAGDIDNVVNISFITYIQFIKYRADTDIIDGGFFESYPFLKKEKNGRLAVKSEKISGINDKTLSELFMFIGEEIERMQMGAPNYTKRENKFGVNKNGDCSSVAIHEVGHAVVCLIVRSADKPFDIITTLPRGDASGYVSNSERILITKSDYENEIRMLMGGRIAEELFYGKGNISTGASADMRNATYYAKRMVEMWGFSDEFGFMTLSVPGGKYLGGSVDHICSEAYREKSDEAVNGLLKKLYQETLWMLKDKKDLIENLAREVFNKETMTGEEFKKSYEEALKK